MLNNIYSKTYGWFPLRYLLIKQKNFYTARKKWLRAHIKEKSAKKNAPIKIKQPKSEHPGGVDKV